MIISLTFPQRFLKTYCQYINKPRFMQKNRNFLLLQVVAATFAFVLLPACRKDHADNKTETYTYTIHTPIYQSKTDALASINGLATAGVNHAGKLYIKGNFIYLNDVNKGIHIIDNSNPSHPVQV